MAKQSNWFVGRFIGETTITILIASKVDNFLFQMKNSSKKGQKANSFPEKLSLHKRSRQRFDARRCMLWIRSVSVENIDMRSDNDHSNYYGHTKNNTKWLYNDFDIFYWKLRTTFSFHKTITYNN